MTELFLSGTMQKELKKKLNPETLSKLGLEYEIVEEKDGFSITGCDAVIYGNYQNGLPQSIYIYRCKGDVTGLMRKIDSVVFVEIYDFEFLNLMYCSEWTKDEFLVKWEEEVTKQRLELGLSKEQTPLGEKL